MIHVWFVSIITHFWSVFKINSMYVLKNKWASEINQDWFFFSWIFGLFSFRTSWLCKKLPRSKTVWGQIEPRGQALNHLAFNFFWNCYVRAVVYLSCAFISQKNLLIFAKNHRLSNVILSFMQPFVFLHTLWSFPLKVNWLF